MSDARTAPDVSILVVTSDRVDDLRRCLSKLREHLADPPCPTAEVRTVHGPDDDVAMQMVAREFPEVHVHRSPAFHISKQRNLAAEAARGRVLIYLDDDAFPHAGWLSAIYGAFAEAKIVAASGPVQRGCGSMQCERLASSPIGRLIPLSADQPLPPGFAPSFSGCNLAIRRDALLAIGGFDENLPYQPDDMDVTARLFAHAGRNPDALRYEPLARVTHESSPGPYRRTLEDRAWFTVARDNVYYAMRHAGVLRGALGGALLQVPKVLRFSTWMLQGKLRPLAALRCMGKHTAGTLAGLVKGLRRARLPLPMRITCGPSDAGQGDAEEHAQTAASSGSGTHPKEPACRQPTHA
ncbi:MAG: glycosyltransferase family 2 protein [Planctomycetota bacterium]